MASAENILTLTYDFLLYLIPELSKYPRDQKFLLGDRIQTLALEFPVFPGGESDMRVLV